MDAPQFQTLEGTADDSALCFVYIGISVYRDGFQLWILLGL